MATMKIKLELPSDAEMKRMFDAIPALERHDAADKITRSAGMLVKKRLSQLIPRSSKSDIEKQSTEGKKLDGKSLKTTPRRLFRKNSKAGGVSVVGPEYTGKTGAGQKIFLIAKWKTESRHAEFWGHPGQTYTRRGAPYKAPHGKVLQRSRNLVTQAFDETKQQQLSAMKTVAKQVMDEVWKRG